MPTSRWTEEERISPHASVVVASSLCRARGQIVLHSVLSRSSLELKRGQCARSMERMAKDAGAPMPNPRLAMGTSADVCTGRRGWGGGGDCPLGKPPQGPARNERLGISLPA